MREILFRGKREDNGEWAESTYPFGTMSSGAVVHDFDTSTIGQYTGLTDKYGKKIFEGDIVRITLATGWKPIMGVSSVYFDKGCFLVNWGNYSATFDSFVDSTIFEIIGNVHDNPELLEVAK